MSKMYGDNSDLRAYCLKVPKILGEKTIKTLIRLGVLAKNLKILRDGDYLFIPIEGKLPKDQMDELKREIPQLEVSIREFQRYEEKARSILDVVGDKLPPHLLASIPHSIDFIGDIAILEFPQELEGYKQIIGEATLQAYKRVRSVLAKSSTISGVYRIREYEVIAGSNNTETVHKEYGCKYYLDPRKVYFSPRLSYEHYRVASQVGENETIVDMFAGVGPFSILIAKTHKNVKVYAVDINPYAIKYLKRNIDANNVQGKVIPILGDAKEVVQSKLSRVADRVIMNLPEKALEYIEVACNALKPSGGIIHYYKFAEGPYALENVKKQLGEAINRVGRTVGNVLSERTVKEVAPFKWQVSIEIEVH